MSTLYADEPIDGTQVFTGPKAARGLRLNRLAASLAKSANREAFLNDETGYANRFSLTSQEKDMLARRDWDAMIEYGATVYLLLKIAATTGSNLLEMGSRMRGESLEAFMQSRPGTKARPRSK